MGDFFFHRIHEITPLGRRLGRALGAWALCLIGPSCDAPPPPAESDAGTGVVESAPAIDDAPPLPSASASASPSEIDRVRDGDLAAMKRLELMPPAERSIEQILALTEGRETMARADATRLVDDLRADAKLRLDPSTLAYAAKLALDQAAAPVLLAGLAEIGDPLLLDFVHDLGARADRSARVPLMIHDLLRVKVVRSKASKALAVLLDLEDGELCWQVANQLGRAAGDADSRAAAMLDRFTIETGCGPKKLDDCWPCLREAANADTLQKAIAGAAARKFDAFWLAK